MPTNTSGLNPYIDAGTGAHPGPPASVTVESPPDHLSGPTGASPNPPESVTYYADDDERPVKAKAITAAEVEDKAIRPSTTKRK